jgi:hypothetical protein
MKEATKYLIRLTDDLIATGKYAEWHTRLEKLGEFFEHVRMDLSIGKVAEMSPDRLGRILASFEVGHVMATKEELFAKVTFSGNCEELLRELVAVCLAYFIRDRFDPTCAQHVPPYPTVK